MKSSVAVSVRIPRRTSELLDVVARETDRSRSYLIVRALDTYLDEHAEYQIAIERLKDKDDPIVSSEEFWKRASARKTDRVQGVRPEGSRAASRKKR
jgi:RHH-type rel operon transcriptional repressor/antitoxin RelB